MNKNSTSNPAHTMLTHTLLYEEAERRLEENREHRQHIEKELRNAPPGLIHIVKSGKRTQFYLRKDRSDRGGKYIFRFSSFAPSLSALFTACISAQFPTEKWLSDSFGSNPSWLASPKRIGFFFEWSISIPRLRPL